MFIRVMMRLLVRLFFLLLLAGHVCGCGQVNADQKEMFRIAYVMSRGGTSDLGAEKIKELIEQHEGLNLEVKLYPNAVLGRDRELMEALKLKQVDLVIGGPSVIGMYEPEYQVLEAPFLFRDYNHLHHVLHGKIGQRLEDEMSNKYGFHYLGYFLRGPRYLTTTDKKIEDPKDLSGLKLRVPELEIYIKAWEAFGANPTPLAFSDMFMALRQGVVEGQENPLEVIYTNNFQEVQKYVMNTQHLLSFYLLVVGDNYYKKFNASTREIIEEIINEAVRYHDDLLESYESKYRLDLVDAGVEFVDVDRAAFENIAKVKLPETFGHKWKEGLFEEILETK